MTALVSRAKANEAWRDAGVLFVDFSNGPQLRNKYLHGSQANAEGEDAHFRIYLIALRLILALVVKMNDDFCLAAQ